MITATNFSYGFPNKDLYSNISFTIETGNCCAFIGSSGSGKSTLAKIIMSPDDYMYDGDLKIEDGCNIHYVSQFYDIDKTQTITVFDYIAQPFVKLESEIADICTQLETATELETLLENYQEALDKFSAIDGDNFENNINKNLGLAGLADKSEQQLSKLSGGEYKLVQVLKQMLTKPDIIILDEPDAFLDFDNLNALKNLIQSYKGTMLAITHSRYLLNHCFNKIIHLENKQLQQFDGRYIDYNVELLQSKVELQELAFADEEEIARNEALIEKLRFIATNFDSPQNGRALYARMKIQERLEARKIINPFVYVDKPNINFGTVENPLDQPLLTVTDLSIAFDKPLLSQVNFEINATDKVAIIGANGAGKTTLMKAIYKNSNPAINFHQNVDISYLSQDQNETLTESNDIYDEFFQIGFRSYDEIQEYLKGFGFPEEKLSSKVSSLSGGEKNILGLAKISKTSGNLLILDEPTSHLDTYGQIALEEALNAYNGGVLMISHDFYSIVNCMDYLLLIENNTVRKVQMRKFRKMIYAQHFNKDYLQIEQDKKIIETKIESALHKNNFTLAQNLLVDLEKTAKLL